MKDFIKWLEENPDVCLVVFFCTLGVCVLALAVTGTLWAIWRILG